MDLLLKNGYVVDAANDFEGKADILINKGKIIATGTPSEIKKKTNTNNLRDAFFVLAGDSNE